METKVVRFVAHGLHSPEVQARLAEGELATLWRMDKMNRRMLPKWERMKADINALVNNQRSADYCIPAFWKIVDDLYTEAAKGNVACKRGCNHCCHISVLISQDEADVIGKRIKRKPKQLTPAQARTRDDAFDWGYHNPCTFLVDGECSIYENRPLPCRLQYSLDVDALLCELTPPETKPVPYTNPLPFLQAFLQMIGVPYVRPVIADIRDFFPKETKK